MIIILLEVILKKCLFREFLSIFISIKIYVFMRNFCNFLLLFIIYLIFFICIIYILYICVDNRCLLYLVDTSPLLCEEYNNGDIFQSDYLYKPKNSSEEYLSPKNIENDTSCLNNSYSRFKCKLYWNLWDLKVFKNTISWILNRRNPSKVKEYKRPKNFTPVFYDLRKNFRK